MGQWRRATFKEYIREELTCYSEGMPKDMEKKFGFVNISAVAIRDVTNMEIINDCNTTSTAA